MLKTLLISKFHSSISQFPVYNGSNLESCSVLGNLFDNVLVNLVEDCCGVAAGVGEDWCGS